MGNRKVVVKTVNTGMPSRDTIRRAALSTRKTSVASNVLTDKDIYKKQTYTLYSLIPPKYLPTKLQQIVESSSILPQCIVAYVNNIDGFGYEFQFTGKEGDQVSEAAKKEKDWLTEYFNKVNEKESITSLRCAVRLDIETTGNGYIEVVRDESGDIVGLYHVPAAYVRMQYITEDQKPVEVKVELTRKGGTTKEYTVEKYFRRYAMISPDGRSLRWFKEYGDTRSMDAVTGAYAGGDEEPQSASNDDKKTSVVASEIIHFKIGNDLYGAPRWVGASLTALGMTAADRINYDLFGNQMVPPMVVMVSGGELNDESLAELVDMFYSRKGIENYHKCLLLEAQSDGSVDDKSTAKIEFKEMVSRKDDALFVEYTDKGEGKIRTTFRLPDMYIGKSEAYSRSTADSSRMVAEEQIFVPERNAFDEFINLNIMKNELGVVYWKFHSKGPKMINSQDAIKGFEAMTRLGAFSIDDAIKFANQIFDTDLTEYQEDWSVLPAKFILDLVARAVPELVEQITGIKISVPEGGAQHNGVEPKNVTPTGPDPTGTGPQE